MGIGATAKRNKSYVGNWGASKVLVLMSRELPCKQFVHICIYFESYAWEVANATRKALEKSSDKPNHYITSGEKLYTLVA